MKKKQKEREPWEKMKAAHKHSSRMIQTRFDYDDGIWC